MLRENGFIAILAQADAMKNPTSRSGRCLRFPGFNASSKLAWVSLVIEYARVIQLKMARKKQPSEGHCASALPRAFHGQEGAAGTRRMNRLHGWLNLGWSSQRWRVKDVRGAAACM